MKQNLCYSTLANCQQIGTTRLVYFQLALAHFNGQGHAHFIYEYLVNGDGWDERYFCHK